MLCCRVTAGSKEFVILGSLCGEDGCGQSSSHDYAKINKTFTSLQGIFGFGERLVGLR